MSRILVADDHEDSANSMAQLLTLVGHETFIALDGETAFQRALDVHPDIALIDLELPLVDGWALARRFRDDPTLCEVALVCISGRAVEENDERLRASGFDRILNKPVFMETLFETLGSVTRSAER